MTRLEIVSDPVCPWCYVGAANLMRALAAHPQHPFALYWRPYQLNPDLPPEGMDPAAYLARKFGAGRNSVWLHAATTPRRKKRGRARGTAQV